MRKWASLDGVRPQGIESALIQRRNRDYKGVEDGDELRGTTVRKKCGESVCELRTDEREMQLDAV